MRFVPWLLEKKSHGVPTIGGEANTFKKPIAKVRDAGSYYLQAADKIRRMGGVMLDSDRG